MIAPAWLATRTQPIGIDDVLSYLSQAPHLEASTGRELQIGGPDVLTYGEMLDVMALTLGKRPRPKIPVPFLTPWLSSLWIGLVTPVDAGVARPLIEGLSTETVVTDDSARRLFDIEPAPFEVTLRQALAEDKRVPPLTLGAPDRTRDRSRCNAGRLANRISSEQLNAASLGRAPRWRLRRLCTRALDSRERLISSLASRNRCWLIAESTTMLGKSSPRASVISHRGVSAPR